MSDYKDLQIKKLESDNSRLGFLLAIAVIGLIIAGLAYFTENGTNARQAEMIETCVSEIENMKSELSNANDSIESANYALDEIASESSSYAWEDYESQGYMLEEIGSYASSSQVSGGYGDFYFDCSQISGSDSEH